MSGKHARIPLLLLLVVYLVPAQAPARAQTQGQTQGRTQGQTQAQPLAHIRQNATLRCGLIAEIPEYATTDDHGPRLAFDAELCKAVAVAILGPAARIVLTQYPDDVAAIAALRAGAVELIPTLTADFSHAAGTGVAFTPPILHDGVGFLVPIAAHLSHAEELDDEKICYFAETEVELSLRAWFARQHLSFVPFPFQEDGEMEAAFVTGNCAALAGDMTRLAASRLNFGPLAGRYALLPETISKDPLAAASLSSDTTFAQIVLWTTQVLIQAEENGLTQRSLPSGPAAEDPALARLLGETREIGPPLGLEHAWAANVIAAVGNYGEVYDRTLGDGSPTQLPRGQNRLSMYGGLLYALPIK